MACSPVPKVGGAAAPSAPPVPTPMRAPVVCAVAVGGGRIDVIINQPAEAFVSTQSEALTSFAAGVAAVSVQITQDEDVVGSPVSLYSGVHVNQCLHLRHRIVRVRVHSD